MLMKYIVAVSGGLDSVALLHMLSGLQQQDSNLELVVAHADHGIREDSDADAWHVAALAKRYGLPFEVTRLALSPYSSEQQARDARYQWLESVQEKHRADGIITAHHQDDQLETIILNFQRGTGWRGLASLRTTDERLRPLLSLSKAQLARYAIDNQLVWREDSTNGDIRYTRNYIRHAIVPKLDVQSRKRLSELAAKQRQLRAQIEHEVAGVLKAIKDDTGLSRHELIMLPDSIALEVLRAATLGHHEPLHMRRLLHFVKTGRQGAVLHLGKGKNALLTKQRVII